MPISAAATIDTDWINWQRRYLTGSCFRLPLPQSGGIALVEFDESAARNVRIGVKGRNGGEKIECPLSPRLRKWLRLRSFSHLGGKLTWAES
jgi:hypothetical protein